MFLNFAVALYIARTAFANLEILLALLKVWDVFASEGVTANPGFLPQQIVQVAHPLPDENYEVPLQIKVTSSWDDIPMPRSSERVFSIFHTSRSK